MPGSISLGLLILGGVLILIGFLGGNFKLFGAEVAATISNRWLRFSAIVFGVVLLIAAGMASDLSNSTVTNSSSGVTTPAQSITVYADSMKGTPWTNKENGYVKVSYEAVATDRWLAIPEDNSDAGVPDNAKGYLSPNGDPNFNSNTTVCTKAPLAALVVIGEDKQCKAYGAQNSFELKPGETAYFMMNDVAGMDMYQDNKGQISVNLSISRV